MDLPQRIEELKEERNAVILAHNYQLPEVQEVADYTGDSLGLSIKASEAKAEVIVFCGVDFMAESAKILSPSKKVLLPEWGAKCPMAAMCTPEAIREKRREFSQASVVGYVNTSAACKAEMDYCCTSANAVKVVESVDADQIIFVPDMNLGQYVQRFTDKRIILWPGFCPTHQAITPQMVRLEKQRHPEAAFIAHPECRPEVIDMADFVGSTSQMIDFVAGTDRREVIVGTESDMIYRLKGEAPHIEYHPLPVAVCPTMKMITVESIRHSLESLTPSVELDEEVINRAKVPLSRMTEIGR